MGLLVRDDDELPHQAPPRLQFPFLLLTPPIVRVAEFQTAPKVSNPKRATWYAGFPRFTVCVFRVHYFLRSPRAPRRGAMIEMPESSKR